MKNPGIYVLTNNINGKAYVGLDNNLPNRAKKHLRGKSNCPAISAAVKKHGRDNFTVETIAYPSASHAALCAIEKWHIAKRNTKAPNGYNLTDGGDGTFGYKHSIETRTKMSQSRVNPSLETREKRSKSNRENHARYWKGKTFSKSHRQKMSESLRGTKNPFFGKKHTDKARQKMSETKRQRSLRKRGQGTLF